MTGEAEHGTFIDTSGLPAVVSATVDLRRSEDVALIELFAGGWSQAAWLLGDLGARNIVKWAVDNDVDCFEPSQAIHEHMHKVDSVGSLLQGLLSDVPFFVHASVA